MTKPPQLRLAKDSRIWPKDAADRLGSYLAHEYVERLPTGNWRITDLFAQKYPNAMRHQREALQMKAPLANQRRPHRKFGDVAEWLIAPDCKSGKPPSLLKGDGGFVGKILSSPHQELRSFPGRGNGGFVEASVPKGNVQQKCSRPCQGPRKGNGHMT